MKKKKEFPKPYSITKKREALKILEKSAFNGKVNFSATAKETGISISTLKLWWTNFQLEKQQELKTQLECAITTILGRMKKLAEETNNLKELAPVVKMLSELLQQVGDEAGNNEGWG